MIGLVEAPLKARPDVAIPARITKITQRHVSSTSSELQMRWKVLQILLRRFIKWKTGSSLMEWMMILVRSSSGSSSIKHNTAGIIKEKGRK
jgi:hypothetical protein